MLGLLASMVGLLPIVTTATAEAAGTQEGVQARLANTVHAYVRAGESLEVSGTDGAIGTVTAPDGQSATGAGTYGPAATDGVWLVELDGLGPNTGYVWTVDVIDDAGTVPGRVWTTRDRIMQSGGTAAMRDLEYWVVNDTGYIYSIELNAYNGVNSEILANSVGWADEDCAPTYASYEFDATGIGNNAPPLPDCGETYRIFYEEPAADLPADAASAAGEVTVVPPVLGEADLEVDDLAFTPAAPGAAAGTFTYSIDPRFTGGYRLQIDVDGNGSYDDAVDRAITLGADGRGAYSHEFDGLDGTGAAIADCTQMNARIHFDKVGEVHIVQNDVEGRAGGIEIVRLNGESSPDATIHWNDEGMPRESTTTTPVLVGEGIDSTGGVHGWDYDTYGWGNGRYIDDWAYLPLDLGTGEIQIGGQCLTIEKTSDRTPDTRAGDTVEYTVTATNSGTADYTAAHPAVVLDDLTGVLDDAVYNDDAEASRPGEVTYVEPTLGWSGALAAGDAVELTYSVELTSAGDGTVRNVAWTPNDPDGPEDPTPPACTDAPDGVDAVTGEACADVEYPLPRLSIAKSADLDEASAVGETIAYTIEVTNQGPGDYTATAPATFTDDLSGVLDAATYNGDAEASTGDLTYEAPNLAWAGPLAAGESVTVTYTATYTGAGDQHLLNEACVPASQVAPGFAPCDLVELPGSDLHSWKEVSASDTPAVAGTVLTYTLHFRNDGQAAATVDAVDDLTHVTDDADVTTEPASPVLSAERDGDRIAVTGTLPAGESTTVTYEVTLRADGDRGDDVAANFLLPSGEEPPTDPVCEPADSEFPDCTSTPVAAVSYAKSVEASTSPVVAGTELTYTITATNSGTATGTVSREDVLTGVLDDAELTGAPTSDTTSVIVSDVTDERFTISGELPGGASATVTYTVTVRPDADRGDNRADNFLVPPGETPPAECEEGDECTSTPMPLIEATKSVSPESGTTVHPGEEVTYTLTFANSGTAPGAVEYTDHLTGVLDDAALTGGPQTSDAALAAELAADDTIVVTGSLDAGQTVAVTYTVTVAPDGARGDNVLANMLAPTDATDPDCEEVGVSCTSNPVPLLESWKTVEADTSPVAAGTVLTYTLHFENSGAAAATVEHVDDLTHVLDDAEVTSEPVSTDLASHRTGERITIDGTVPVGQTRTVTYQVTVRPDGDRGDDLAANFLLADDPENPPAPPADPVCQPADHERPDCTITPIGHLATVKSVSADSDPIVAGTILTFTLTFDNQGRGPVLVDHVDHLAGVLDDADLTAAPVASDPALSVSEVVDDAFGVTGELPAGRQVEVTYEVTVTDEAERGDNLVMNALTPSSQEPPAECEEDDPNCTLTPLPSIEPTKTADPEPGSGVQAGEEVTYTLSFSNVGEAAGPVDHTDHLTEVLDDADLTGAPVTSDPALVASSGADGAIRVTGTLEPGQTVTVDYTVTVRADGERGDNLLRNVVAPSSVTDPDCEATTVICTEHPIGQIESWKTVDPASGSTVRPGAELTYTLHFRNVGNAVADVAYEDLLDGVLDDADLTTEPRPSTDALVASEIDGARFTVTGSLAAGKSATVSYTVTVSPDGERGDDRLENLLVPTGQEPPTGPCAPADPARANCTVNPVSSLEAPTPLPSTGASVSAAALWTVLGLLTGGGVLMLSRRMTRRS